jgi:hypothetical protein
MVELGNGGIDVPHDQHRRRGFRVHHGLETLHDLGGLYGVAGRADLQFDIRLRYAQLGEKGLVHLRVVVLPGVHQFYRNCIRI